MAKAPAKSSKKKSFKKKEKKNIPLGVVHIQATFNNTIVTVTDQTGNVVAWSSSGSLGRPAGRAAAGLTSHPPGDYYILVSYRNVNNILGGFP